MVASTTLSDATAFPKRMQGVPPGGGGAGGGGSGGGGGRVQLAVQFGPGLKDALKTGGQGKHARQYASSKPLQISALMMLAS